jgi:LytS/YehU family sensor histidine kinase
MLPLFTVISSEASYFIQSFPAMGGAKHLGWPILFWEYFNIIFIYLFLFSGVHIFENYIQLKQQQEKEKELLKLAHQSEMNTLKAQIQPHFLFNTLNSISASVPSHLEHTRVLIARLADTFRFALNASANEAIPLREELAFIKAYLDLEKERFHDRLSVHYHIDPAILDMEVPPMLLQPIVENSLQHGIARSLRGGNIDISVHQVNGSVHFEISDTGAGLSEGLKKSVPHNGMGLQNVNQRLQKLYGTSISMQENRPSGVKVSFDIPVNSQQ